MIMPPKHLLSSLFLFSFSFCCCAGAYSQNIEVSLEFDLYSPYIKKYTQEQMAQKLLDSVISYCRSRYLKLGRPINIYAKGCAESKSDLPSYRLKLRVEDTVFNVKHFTDVHSVMVKSKFYEEEIPADSIKGWTGGGGGSYSLMPPVIRSVESKPVKAQTTEAGAIDGYFTWATIEAGMALDWSMPLSLTERIPARNIFEKEELDRLESFAEMAVKVQTEKIDASKKEETDRLIIMINNIFYNKQGREARRRSLDKGRSYLNYYFTTDSLGYTGPTVHGHPIELKLIIEPVGQSNYQLRLEFDEQKYSFKSFFGVPQKQRIIPVGGETLRKRPSQVNSDITKWIETFVNSNVR